MTLWLWFYLIVGSIIGIKIASIFKRVLENNNTGGIFEGSIREQLDSASPELRIQIEIWEDYFVFTVAVITAIIWLPLVVFILIPACFQGVVGGIRDALKEGKNSKGEDHGYHN